MIRYKGLIIALTGIILLLCFYYLSFTFISRSIEGDAKAFATRNGQFDPRLQQQYLDSIYTGEAFSIAGIKYSYKEIKEQEVKLGLDLLGGMHITMEVSAADIVLALANNPADPQLRQIVQATEKEALQRNVAFMDAFRTNFQRGAQGRRMAEFFANKGNRDRLEYGSTDDRVLSYLDSEVDNTLDRSFKILRARIDKFGVAQPNIQRLEGTNRIQVELPGIDNPERVRKLLQGVAQLEFFEVFEASAFNPYLTRLNDMLARDERAGKKLDLSGPETATAANTAANTATTQDSTLAALAGGQGNLDSAALASASRAGADTAQADTSLKSSTLLARLFIPMYNGLGARVKDTGRVNRLLARPEVRSIFPANMVFMWGAKALPLQDGDQTLALYPIRRGRDGKAPLDGSVITSAQPDFSPLNGQPEVSMRMDGTGARIWRRLTANNVGKQVAIVLDNAVYSAPNVQGEIPNGSSSISGSFTIEEAKDLANILEAGRLPVPIRIVEEEVVGPSLGQESINQGLISIFAGFVTIIIFMIAFYSTSGLIANLAVLLNVFLILGILVPFDAVLTLPGIAGIVLTIGMAVDANVLINERIKDELRKGLPKPQAIDEGYRAASRSIWDANLTTLLAGIVLLFFGSGPVQGFATTLIVGIITSLLTSVYITRIIMDWRLSRGSDVNIYTEATKDFLKNVNFNFVSRRRMAYIASTIFLTLGLISVFTRGLDLGVDFAGGWRYQVRVDGSTSSDQIRTTLQPLLGSYPEVKTLGSAGSYQITTDHRIDDGSPTVAQEVEQIINRGFTQLGQPYEMLSSSRVGPTVANDIKRAAYLSVAIAMGLIFLYIRMRFSLWQFALGATLAVLHDMGVIIVCFSLFKDILPFSLEIDQNFIAALLTVVGFSVNDTVVVFDRVREKAREMDLVGDPARVVNAALNETFSRTIITSGTLYLVVLILLLFGGDTLKGLSFALLIGVIVGTYSTVYIAIPFVVDALGMRRGTKSTGTLDEAAAVTTPATRG